MAEIGFTPRPAQSVAIFVPVQSEIDMSTAQTQRVQPIRPAPTLPTLADRRTAPPPAGRVSDPLPETRVAPPSALQLRISSWLSQQAVEKADRDQPEKADEKPELQKQTGPANPTNEDKPAIVGTTDKPVPPGDIEVTTEQTSENRQEIDSGDVMRKHFGTLNPDKG